MVLEKILLHLKKGGDGTTETTIFANFYLTN